MSKRHYYMISNGEYSDYCVGGMICTPYKMTQEKWDMIVRRYVVNRIPNLLLMSEHIKADWVFYSFPPTLSEEVEQLLANSGYHEGIYSLNQLSRTDFFKWVREKKDPTLELIDYAEIHDGVINKDD